MYVFDELSKELKELIDKSGAEQSEILKEVTEVNYGHFYLLPLKNSEYALYFYNFSPFLVGVTGYDRKGNQTIDKPIDATRENQILEEAKARCQAIKKKIEQYQPPQYKEFLSIINQIVLQYDSQTARVRLNDVKRTLRDFDKSVSNRFLNMFLKRTTVLTQDESKKRHYLVDKAKWTSFYTKAKSTHIQ